MAEPAVVLQAMGPEHLDRVLQLQQGLPQPWTRGQFADCLAADHWARCLLKGAQVLGCVVAMAGYREAHLLELLVGHDYRRQGWGRVLLQALQLWASGAQAEALWLEVRCSNRAALALYRDLGFVEVGRRKDYYPSTGGQREDALLMNCPLPVASCRVRMNDDRVVTG